MRPAKQTKSQKTNIKPVKPQDDPKQSLHGDRFFQGVDGKLLPIKYNGNLLWIGPKYPVGVFWDKVPYESKFHIEQALKAGEIQKVGVPEKEQAKLVAKEEPASQPAPEHVEPAAE